MPIRRVTTVMGRRGDGGNPVLPPSRCPRLRLAIYSATPLDRLAAVLLSAGRFEMRRRKRTPGK